MTSGVTKAVVPVAGLGTRFLPATKATPKEMLPVVDKPAIQYVVEEAVRAGLDDVLIVTGRSKTPIEDHFDRHYELEDRLEGDEGKRDLLDQVRGVTELATVHYVRQGEARGLGHAVLCAAQHVGNQPFAVLLGDDLIDERDVLLTRDDRACRSGSAAASSRCSRCRRTRSGCTAAPRSRPPTTTDVVRITGLGREAAAGRGAEQPGDHRSLRALARDLRRHSRRRHPVEATRSSSPMRSRRSPIGLGDGGPVHGVIFRGRRYDTGDKADYLKAIVQLACDREDLGPEFREWLGEFVAGRLPQGDPSEPLKP